jgi:hypothetical protein
MLSVRVVDGRVARLVAAAARRHVVRDATRPTLRAKIPK